MDQRQVVQRVGDRGSLRHPDVHPVELAGAVEGDDRCQAHAVAQRLEILGSGQLWEPRLVAAALLRLDLGDERVRRVTDPQEEALLVVPRHLHLRLGIETPDRRHHSIARHHFLRVQHHQALYHSHMSGLKKRQRIGFDSSKFETFFFEKSLSPHHLERRILNEDRLGELGVVRLRQVNTFPGEGLQDAAVILIVIIWIRVDVRQRQTVQLRIGKCVDDLRLQVFLILKQKFF